MMKILDLSTDVFSGMAVFPGDPGVRIERERSFPEYPYQVTSLHLGSHTGTHIDAPRHFLPYGAAVPDIGLFSFVGEAICVRPSLRESRGRAIIEWSEAQRQEIREGDRVIFSTGWEKKAGTPEYFVNYPLFSDEWIAFLLEKRPLLIGADLPTLAGMGDPFLMHREFFENRTIFVEGLVRTGELPTGRFFFSAAPIKIENGDGSPVRAYAIVDE